MNTGHLMKYSECTRHSVSHY